MKKIAIKLIRGLAFLAFVHLAFLIITNGRLDIVQSILQGFRLYFG